jgi:hypothetical protein
MLDHWQMRLRPEENNLTGAWIVEGDGVDADDVKIKYGVDCLNTGTIL